jgi:hypothetical protein
MSDPAWVAKNRRAMYNVLPGIETWKPAYKLSQEEARDIAVSYVLNNLLTLEKPVTFGADGAPTYPKIGEKPKLRLDNIGGAAYVCDNKAYTQPTTGPMDLRTAVLAVRLARYLREQSKWGVSVIYWGGMGVGRSDTDRHGKGYAIDFHGAVTRYGKFDVQTDWGSKPVTLPDGTKRFPTATNPDPWPVTVQPYYRLDADTHAGGFFYAVYHFLAGEASDNGTTQESSIGGRTQILCPDTPDVVQRPKHQNHIHCEVDI